MTAHDRIRRARTVGGGPRIPLGRVVPPPNENHRSTARRRSVSTGHILDDGEWLGTQVETCREEYEATLQSIGSEHRCRVLDASCGSDSVVPCMADLVGPTGRIVGRRLSARDLGRPVEPTVGSLTAPPGTARAKVARTQAAHSALNGPR
jgi:hypothetical protein